MKPWTLASLVRILLASLGVWLVLATACLLVGSTEGLGWPTSAVAFRFRLEMILLASLIGASLSAAGVVYQAILQNPLAEPYLLGVSSGASLAVYVWQIVLPASVVGSLVSGFGQQSIAFVGALLTVAFVFALSTRRGRLEPITLLLVGVIVNAFNGSIFLLLNSLVKDQATPGGPLAFLVGGIQTNLTGTDKLVSAGVSGIGWIVLLSIAGQLNVAMLSEAEATSLGVRIQRLRWLALVVASIVTASAVAISGPIGFVGLVCPHIARLIVGNDQRRLLPISVALGAGLLAGADALTRWMSATGRLGTVLPVGVITGLFGGPFFLSMLWRTRHRA